MKDFGAERYVASLVAIAMVRELAPLMTAILLAGRSGSAFAAEIGTMKVNEEVDALVTMGLNPVRFLIVPRVLALVLLTPLLTVFANLLGLLGGMVVYLMLGFPFVSYFQEVKTIIDGMDLAGGVFKSFVFGILVAGIGCLRGLEAGRNPLAVGESATRAVVSGILLIVLADGILTVVYYTLGI
jgi:phospholipid/cholesterol/gamma-HCH transport system permease protein